MPSSIFYGVLVALIWGAQPVVSRYGFQLGLNAADATLVRYLASGLLMLPYAWRRGLADACGLGWRKGLCLFLLSGPLFSLILIGGVSYAPASHGALIHPALVPLFGALISRFGLRRQERFSLISMGLLLAGLLLIGGDSLMDGHALASGAWRGDLLFVLSALMWALYMVLNKSWNTRPLDVVALVQVLSLSYVLPYLLLHGMHAFEHPPGLLVLQAFYHGVLVSVVGVALFNWVVSRLGVKALMFNALSPLFGVALSSLLLQESLKPSLLMGAALIVAGLVWSLRGARQAPQTQS
jgi:drug/metabolite transporter (DMT)-like permease